MRGESGRADRMPVASTGEREQLFSRGRDGVSILLVLEMFGAEMDRIGDPAAVVDWFRSPNADLLFAGFGPIAFISKSVASVVVTLVYLRRRRRRRRGL